MVILMRQSAVTKRNYENKETTLKSAEATGSGIPRYRVKLTNTVLHDNDCVALLVEFTANARC